MNEDSWQTVTIALLLLMAAAGLGILVLENCS
jgi:hypothetical protein